MEQGYMNNSTDTSKKNNYPIHDPLWNFDEDFLAQLSQWLKQGEEIVLMLDMNDNIYTSRFARRLRKLGFEELFQRTNSAKAPYSHITGSEPICAVFVTQGIDCTGYYIF